MRDTFDYIVVGAGSAGCVVAGRLTENRNVSVCLVEAGGVDKSMLIHMPAGFPVMVSSALNNWAFQTVPQPGLNGRRGYQPRGKTLGGSSSINAMLYVRGHRWDYDHWASLGNPGWSYDDVLPYFRKAEHNETYNDRYHGQGGPLNVRDASYTSKATGMFLASARAAGLPVIGDYNGENQYGACVFQVTQKNGERCSAAKAYVTPNLTRPNLTLSTNTTTQKIVLDGTRAVGVEVRAAGRSALLKARREVILSAGAFGSPQMLMLSGIGPGAQLQHLGIAVVCDLPGVGENLQDHLDYVYACRGPGAADTFGLSVRGASRLARGVWRWRTQRRGLMTSVICESGAFIRSQPNAEIPDMQIVFIAALEDDHGRKLHLGHGFSGRVALLRPKSRGTVKLATPKPDDAPAIDPRFLSASEDLELLKNGAKQMLSILSDESLKAARGSALYPVDTSDDVALEQHIRTYADTQYHPAGSCRMGQDFMAVVDHRLRVRGVQGLRVADASVMPTVVGGNTNAATIMIGEKAADMLREDAAGEQHG